MTAELRDLRATISVRADQTLEAVSLADAKSKQQIVREVLDEWAAKQVHRALLIERMTRVHGRPRSDDDIVRSAAE